MTSLAETTGAAEPPLWRRRSVAAGSVLAALVVAGDALFWQQRPGLSLFVFFVLLIAGVLALHPRRGQTLLLAAAAVAAALPLLEAPSLVGLLTATGGVTLLALGAGDLLPRFEAWSETVLRFAVLAPLRLVADGLRLLRDGVSQKPGGRLWRAIVAWLVPLGLAAVFVLLFTAANPLLERGFRALQVDQLIELLRPGRVVLWGVLAVFAWPFLQPLLAGWREPVPVQGPVRDSVVLGAAAIRNALVLFNLLFAAQTAMDIVFLWGGVRLPDGMSHAEYAHRGAYPLIATAILAGAFVLVAMRRDGPAGRAPLIRALVYVFVAQNVGLVASSLLRLKLYVDAYQLSELRVAAAIWMGLGAVGLVLIVVRIARRRSNRWLLTSNLVALMLTLWGAAWLDVPALVARHNVEHSREMTGMGQPLDLAYARELGPAAIPALDRFLAEARFASRETRAAVADIRATAVARAPAASDWRGWSGRAARLAAYLAGPAGATY
jgi:hypothetical protein